MYKLCARSWNGRAEDRSPFPSTPWSGQRRGDRGDPNLLDRLTDSVERAEAKGATNILALDQSLAFIINVPNGRVITTMSQDEMKENIFTNIDGAVIL